MQPHGFAPTAERILDAASPTPIPWYAAKARSATSAIPVIRHLIGLIHARQNTVIRDVSAVARVMGLGSFERWTTVAIIVLPHRCNERGAPPVRPEFHTCMEVPSFIPRCRRVRIPRRLDTDRSDLRGLS